MNISATTSETSDFVHIPVLSQEVLACLNPSTDGVYVDVTVGGAGHSTALLRASAPHGRLVGLDRDLDALTHARVQLAPYGDRVTLVHQPFSRLPQVLEEAGIEKVDGVLADLGVSSYQLDQSARGFSYQSDSQLDMRMDQGSRGQDAGTLLRSLPERQLADLIYSLGEERRSRRIARSIVYFREKGQMASTADLRRAVERAVGGNFRQRTDALSRVFQAIRIAINDELGELQTLLKQAPSLLKSSGCLVVIAFHSLEDRLVKYAYRDDARMRAMFRRPQIATDDEKRVNPRSRSAKLRAFVRQQEGEL